MKSITDFSGRKISLAYFSDTDTDGNAFDLKSITIDNGPNIAPKVISFTYQKDLESEVLSHNMLTLTDSMGKQYVVNTYDASDRVATQKYGNGTLTYTYTTASGSTHITKTSVINKRGGKSEFIYDDNGNTLTKTLYDGQTPISTNYTYGTGGKIITETKPLGNGTSYTYDALGRTTLKRLKTSMSAPDDDTQDLVTHSTYTGAFPTPTSVTLPD